MVEGLLSTGSTPSSYLGFASMNELFYLFFQTSIFVYVLAVSGVGKVIWWSEGAREASSAIRELYSTHLQMD